MTTSKAANTTSSQQPNPHECCMCGDYGFSYELFQCKVCQFRSQHSYCSNLYPNSPESYRTCNWCLMMTQKEEKSQNSSNSSSSCRNDVVQEDIERDKTTSSKIKIKKNNNDNKLGSTNNNNKVGALILRRQGISSMNLQQLSGPIKKQRSVENVMPSPVTKSPSKSPVTMRKRVLTNGAKEERLRRTRSEEISHGTVTNGINTKHVFRNKVRRYKLLDEVSS